MQEEDQTLGSSFLETVASSDMATQLSYNRDGSLSAEVKGEFMTSLTEAITDTCNQLGRTEHLSSSSDSETGQVQYYSLTCGFDGNETYDEAYNEMMNSIMQAEPLSTSVSNNVHANFRGPDMSGLRLGLEMLIERATTVEELMTIIPSWQNTLHARYPPGMRDRNSINININKAFVHPGMHSNASGYDEPWTDAPMYNMVEHALPMEEKDEQEVMAPPRKHDVPMEEKDEQEVMEGETP